MSRPRSRHRCWPCPVYRRSPGLRPRGQPIPARGSSLPRVLLDISTLGDVRCEIGLNQDTRRQLPHDAGMLNLDALTRGGKRSRVGKSGLLYQTLVVVAGVDEHVAVDTQCWYTEQRAGCSLHVLLFRRLEHQSWMWRETEELHRVADEYGPRPARVLCSVGSQGFVHFGQDRSLRRRKSGGRGVLRCRGRGGCRSCGGDGCSGRYGRRGGSRTWCAGGGFSCSGGGLVATATLLTPRPSKKTTRCRDIGASFTTCAQRDYSQPHDLGRGSSIGTVAPPVHYIE